MINGNTDSNARCGKWLCEGKGIGWVTSRCDFLCLMFRVVGDSTSSRRQRARRVFMLSAALTTYANSDRLGCNLAGHGV